MTKEILEKAIELGKLIAESDEVKAANAAKEKYEKDEAIQAAIVEYNAHNKALAEEYKKAEKDEALMSSIKNRIGELYNEIINSAVYAEYMNAQEGVGTLMNKVNDEINFAVTGERPSEACSGNCASCGGCH
ncbi:MAG: YlbF family regulator [Clostridia bacterium]|nr:YlbF family regulator [Clostridia bacterium]MBQ6614090.1 YlbF family regulator [Clostridia bacterium]